MYRRMFLVGGGGVCRGFLFANGLELGMSILSA